MTYNVFGGTLNLAQSINHTDYLASVKRQKSRYTLDFPSLLSPITHGRSFLCYHYSNLRHTVERYASAAKVHLVSLWPWPWPLTLRTFSATSPRVMNTCANFHWNPSTKYRYIVSCETDINGPQTDGRTTYPNTRSPLPSWSALYTLLPRHLNPGVTNFQVHSFKILITHPSSSLYHLLPLHVIRLSCLGSERPHGFHVLSHAPKILLLC